ncbi:MAG: hypothetical protein QOI47_1416, partial [Actinomycetota bacterium]|nr:hypothetical protein [Actinomycetota bacterium]
DALARFLQDVGNDDTADAGHDTATPWVARRTTVEADGWPRIGERIAITTWCGGIGSHFAERRTTLQSPSGAVEVAATWVHIDEATGRPARLPEWFLGTYGEAAAGRKISARLQHDAPPVAAATQPWPLRWADLDVLGHVNNAAYWEAIEEVCHQRALVPTFAEVEYAAGIDPGDLVQLSTAGDAVWLTVDGSVRASAIIR